MGASVDHADSAAAGALAVTRIAAGGVPKSSQLPLPTDSTAITAIAAKPAACGRRHKRRGACSRAHGGLGQLQHIAWMLPTSQSSRHE